MRRRRSRGISLVELTASIAVLAAVAGGGMALAPAQVRGIVRAHEDDAALAAAEARLETLRGAPALVAAASEFAPDAGLAGVEGTQTLEVAGPGLVRATVVVAWDAADGGRRSVRLVTLLAQEPPR